MSPTFHPCPPWEVIVLVAHHLDPKTLAIASCVCRSWFVSMSSDHLWRPICSTHFPYLFNLQAASPALPYRRLYALGHTSAKRRLRKPPKPRLALDNLTFAVDVRNSNSSSVTVVKSGSELDIDPSGVFRFDIDVQDHNWPVFGALDNLKLTWNVILEGFRGVFTVMDCNGKGSFIPGTGGWFSEELPTPGCCSGVGTSGLVADLRLGFTGVGERKMLQMVGVGVLSVVSWRYVSIDDALRYLQHFLLPFDI